VVNPVYMPPSWFIVGFGINGRKGEEKREKRRRKRGNNGENVSGKGGFRPVFTLGERGRPEAQRGLSGS